MAGKVGDSLHSCDWLPSCESNAVIHCTVACKSGGTRILWYCAHHYDLMVQAWKRSAENENFDLAVKTVKINGW